jgi:hypothetical protein
MLHSFQIPYFDLLVPTVDTVRFGFLLEKLVSIQHSVLFTGMTGVGKVIFSLYDDVLFAFFWQWLFILQSVPKKVYSLKLSYCNNLNA